MHWNANRTIILLALAALTAGCEKEPAALQGYVEGEFVYVSSPLAGTLTHLAVTRGAKVEAGQFLFVLEHETEAAAVSEAEQRLVQARSRLQDLTKGERPSEIAALEGRLAAARADLTLAEIELERQVELRQDDVTAPEELDRARARRDGAQAQVASAAAELETAGLGARADEIEAAEAEVAAETAALAQARWALTQKGQVAPAGASVQDTLYRVGEWVGAGKPVVVLLPPENIKLRFFVPQGDLPSLAPGDGVTVRCDGAAQPYRATVSFISAEAEFTPPVIYSRDNRAKLVFMVEAAFDPSAASSLRPGQPADVQLESAAR